MTIVSKNLYRYISILTDLRNGSYSIDQLAFNYQVRCERKGFDYVFSARTFLRDKADILSIFNIDIQVRISRQNTVYFIDETDKNILNEKKCVTDLFNF